MGNSFGSRTENRQSVGSWVDDKAYGVSGVGNRAEIRQISPGLSSSMIARSASGKKLKSNNSSSNNFDLRDVNVHQQNRNPQAR